jgi:hypothetical protein
MLETATMMASRCTTGNRPEDELHLKSCPFGGNFLHLHSELNEKSPAQDLTQRGSSSSLAPNWLCELRFVEYKQVSL